MRLALRLASRLRLLASLVPRITSTCQLGSLTPLIFDLVDFSDPVDFSRAAIDDNVLAVPLRGHAVKAMPQLGCGIEGGGDDGNHAAENLSFWGFNRRESLCFMFFILCILCILVKSLCFWGMVVFPPRSVLVILREWRAIFDLAHDTVKRCTIPAGGQRFEIILGRQSRKFFGQSGGYQLIYRNPFAPRQFTRGLVQGFGKSQTDRAHIEPPIFFSNQPGVTTRTSKRSAPVKSRMLCVTITPQQIENRHPTPIIIILLTWKPDPIVSVELESTHCFSH